MEEAELYELPQKMEVSYDIAPSEEKQVSSWISRNVLVREVFYVQTILLFTVVISSIVNLAMGHDEDQVWTYF